MMVHSSWAKYCSRIWVITLDSTLLAIKQVASAALYLPPKVFK